LTDAFLLEMATPSSSGNVTPARRLKYMPPTT